MTDKQRSITLESTRYHTHDGIAHDVGDVYDVSDGHGMTADQLAMSFISSGIAKLGAPKTAKSEPAKPTSKPVKPLTTDDLPSKKPKK